MKWSFHSVENQTSIRLNSSRSVEWKEKVWMPWFSPSPYTFLMTDGIIISATCGHESLHSICSPMGLCRTKKKNLKIIFRLITWIHATTYVHNERVLTSYSQSRRVSILTLVNFYPWTLSTLSYTDIFFRLSNLTASSRSRTTLLSTLCE